MSSDVSRGSESPTGFEPKATGCFRYSSRVFTEGNHACDDIPYKCRPYIADWFARQLANCSLASRGTPLEVGIQPGYQDAQESVSRRRLVHRVMLDALQDRERFRLPGALESR